MNVDDKEYISVLKRVLLLLVDALEDLSKKLQEAIKPDESTKD